MCVCVYVYMCVRECMRVYVTHEGGATRGGDQI